MGKPYNEELQLLPESYKWALGEDISKLKDAIQRMGSLPLISIGSGGSFSAAHFHSILHERVTGHLAKPLTPLLASSLGPSGLKAGITLLSAEGKNPDIRGALQHVVKAEPAEILALSLRKDSKLTALLTDTMSGAAVAYEMPWGKDGYLATNSLLATCCLLYRAYQAAFPDVLAALPPSIEALQSSSLWDFTDVLQGLIAAAKDRRRDKLLILHDASSQVLAIDVESKLTESGLFTTAISDFRNFAHGRHLWAYQNRESILALALSYTNEAQKDGVSELVKSMFPVVEVQLRGDENVALVSSILASIKITGTLGEVRGVDPGAPSVPEIGRALYRYDAFVAKATEAQDSIASEKTAVLRKLGASRQSDWQRPYADHLRSEYHTVVARLESSRFSGVVLDYDSTLCTAQDRFDDLPACVTSELVRLLNEGMNIGIATGRGKSAAIALKNAVPEEKHKNVWVGMYNGGLVTRLDRDFSLKSVPIVEELKILEEHVTSDPYLGKVVKCERRPNQLTIGVIDTSLSDHIWALVSNLLSAERYNSLKALKSVHTWDIIPRHSSKCAVSSRLSEESSDGDILCIGDRGRWPGNDCELLGNTLALGVDQVSVETDCAWNLAPAGFKGVSATVFYLKSLIKEDELFRLWLKK